MRPFTLEHAADAGDAVQLAASHPDSSYFAGGTVMLDLMKLDVLRPRAMIDIDALRHEYGAIEAGPDGLHLGALVRMSAAAEHPAIRRDYKALSDALSQAASAQLRNMASLGGNVLQRTRCNYFRDPTWGACNKRSPGSGCAALNGVNRQLAVLGTSEHCIASYPGDFAVPLAAFGTSVELLGPGGARRTLPFEELHRTPGDTPHLETNLQPGELITGFQVPAGAWTRRSLYLKVRERDSYAFALASAAVGLELDGDGTVVNVRIGLGGVATKPWRAHAAEQALTGKALTETNAEAAAAAAFAGAATHGGNDYKPELGRRTLVRALLEAGGMES
jgi:xanthine dehydrogenase YagS FAD-binding subunit